jgi:hypothetical protein
MMDETEFDLLKLEILPAKLALCRLPAETGQTPDWLQPGTFQCIVSTDKETSILCEERFVPPEVNAERGWRGMRLAVPLDFNMVGVLATLLEPLRIAGISILALSTYDTDYVFVKDDLLERSVEALVEAGYVFNHKA